MINNRLELKRKNGHKLELQTPEAIFQHKKLYKQNKEWRKCTES